MPPAGPRCWITLTSINVPRLRVFCHQSGAPTLEAEDASIGSILRPDID